MTTGGTTTELEQLAGEGLSRGRWLLRHAAIPSALYLLVWAVLTWPQVTLFPTHYYCDNGDGFQNIWNLWWMNLSLAQRFASPWSTDLLFWPNSVSLVAHTLNPINGVLAIPLSTVLPDMAVYNLLVVLTFVLGGLTTYWLCYWLTSARWPSLLAGAYFAFSPYHFAHSGSHLQLATLQWIPLFVLCFLRIFEAPGWRTGLAAGVALLLVEASDWYYTLFSILAGALVTAWACVAQRKFLPLMAGYRAAFLTLVALSIGPLLWFLAQLNSLNSGPSQLDGAHNPHVFSTNLLAPLLPGPTWRFAKWTQPEFWGKWPGENPIENAAYYGWVVMAIAAYALLKRRSGSQQPGIWALLIATFFALSLGPELIAHDRHFARVPMPYRLLETVLPTLKLSGCPGRFGVMTTLGFAVLLAMGCAVASRGWMSRWWSRVPLLALALFELWPSAQFVTKPSWPDAVRALRELPDGAVHWQNEPHSPMELMLWQTRFMKPMTDGYVSRVRGETMAMRWELRQLVADGHYSEARLEGKFRYLVLPAGRVTAQLEREWKVVFYGSTYTIWAFRTDRWLTAVRPQKGEPGPADPDAVALSAEVVGPASVDLNIETKSLGGRRVVIALARARRPAFTLPGGAKLELEPDPWLMLCASAPEALFGTAAVVLDPRGRATVRMNLPARDEIRGLQLHAQAFVVCADLAAGFCAASAPVTFRLLP